MEVSNSRDQSGVNVLSDAEPDNDNEHYDVLSDSDANNDSHAPPPPRLPTMDGIDADEESLDTHEQRILPSTPALRQSRQSPYKPPVLSHSQHDRDRDEDSCRSNQSAPLNVVSPFPKPVRSQSFSRDIIINPFYRRTQTVRTSSHVRTMNLPPSMVGAEHAQQALTARNKPSNLSAAMNLKIPHPKSAVSNAYNYKSNKKRARTRYAENRSRRFVEHEKDAQQRAVHDKQTSKLLSVSAATTAVRHHAHPHGGGGGAGGGLEDFSDYTSAAMSDEEEECDHTSSYYYSQVKRWRQRHACCNCMTYSSTCKCLCQLCGILRYYKWAVVAVGFALLAIAMNVYAFQAPAFEFINAYMADQYGMADMQRVFLRAASIVCSILLLCFMCMVYKFYRVQKRNEFLTLDLNQSHKQMDRNRQRRQVIKIQKQHHLERYAFLLKLWNDFSSVHANLGVWIKRLQKLCSDSSAVFPSSCLQPLQNRGGRGGDEDDEKVQHQQKNHSHTYLGNLQKIHKFLQIYDRECNALILSKLKFDIDYDHDRETSTVNEAHQIDDTMSAQEYKLFVRKIPSAHKKQFVQLLDDDRDACVAYHDVYVLLNKLLESYKDSTDEQLAIIQQSPFMSVKGGTATSDPWSAELVSISAMYGGYLQYGDDENDNNIMDDDMLLLSAASTQKTLTTNE
eukprot:CAMPEP_0202730824 /NCGR_PEP_ID=MMETSP1385-20130828/186834_1 /ASSEMBLY_ACC=CAM_ASM_000861 /TAXON_ID=933848 /ORGANISM="Elphidium margaritaceum" /LENGTH=676 /DNA_ID=CAMNT_0049397103 /DNA_START=119 /DNA_END=2149 /DNA_ORIENTATION=+